MLLEQPQLASVHWQQRAEQGAASPRGAQQRCFVVTRPALSRGPMWNKKIKFLSRKRLAAQREKECSC